MHQLRHRYHASRGRFAFGDMLINQVATPHTDTRPREFLRHH